MKYQDLNVDIKSLLSPETGLSSINACNIEIEFEDAPDEQRTLKDLYKSKEDENLLNLLEQDRPLDLLKFEESLTPSLDSKQPQDNDEGLEEECNFLEERLSDYETSTEDSNQGDENQQPLKINGFQTIPGLRKSPSSDQTNNFVSKKSSRMVSLRNKKRSRTSSGSNEDLPSGLSTKKRKVDTDSGRSTPKSDSQLKSKRQKLLDASNGSNKRFFMSKSLFDSSKCGQRPDHEKSSTSRTKSRKKILTQRSNRHLSETDSDSQVSSNSSEFVCTRSMSKRKSSSFKLSRIDLESPFKEVSTPNLDSIDREYDHSDADSTSVPVQSVFCNNDRLKADDGFPNVETNSDEDKIKEAIAKFFMECNIPLGVVEDDHFKRLVELLRPKYISKLPKSKELLQAILKL